MRTIDRFPGIRKVYIEIVYDNGGVFNGMGYGPSRTEEDALDATEPVLSAEGVVEEDLQRLDAWINTLSEEQVITLAAGEHEEMQALAAEGPTGGPDNLPLANIFEDLFEVC